MKNKTKEELLLEVSKIQARLEETEEMLRAIRSGEVDALVIGGAQGEQIYTLKGAEQPYRVLIEEMNEGAATLTADDTILYCNRGFAGLLKVPLEKLIGTEIVNLIAPADHPAFRKLLRKGRAGSGRGDVTFRAGDGTPVPVHLSINTMEMNGVSAVCIVATDLTERKRNEEALRRAHDELEVRVRERTAELVKTNEALQAEIAERRRTEEALAASEEKYRGIFENAVEGISKTTLGGRFITVNPALAHLLGYESPEEFMAEVPDGRRLYVDLSRRDVFVKQIQKHGVVTDFENQLRRRDGSTVWVAVNSRLLRDSSGRMVGFESMLTDITERKKIEEALHRAHNELEERVEERTAELESANRALHAEIDKRRWADERIREQAALLDKARDAIWVQDPEHNITYWNKGAQRLYGWTAEEATGKNADELLYKDRENPELAEAKKCVFEKGEWNGELSHVTKGSKELTVESRWTLLHSRKGKPKSILVINTDITERKRLEAQFLRAQRMESIGTLAGGIAHDLNNILTPIMLSLQVLRERYTDEASQKLLDVLERSARRGSEVVKQVLSFARGVEGERKIIQVAHLISEIEKIAKETFPRSIEIRTELPDGLQNVAGDATQLNQVLMNLCVNARDAMPQGGKLSISAENFSADESFTRTNVEAKVGTYVAIAVSDTGTGIPPEVMERIFEPFFTTKEHGKGSGLGLSTSLAIVKSHGGFIDAESEAGKGATFRMYLPATKGDVREAEERQPELHAGKGELILVVDDEAPVRQITGETLELNGYRVISASDGVDAISLYAQNRNEVKIAIVDMMMPVMDGYACIQALRNINPEIKIIAVSGLAEKDRFGKISDKVSAFLSKPYTSEELLRAVHEV